MVGFKEGSERGAVGGGEMVQMMLMALEDRIRRETGQTEFQASWQLSRGSHSSSRQAGLRERCIVTFRVCVHS